MNSPFRVAQVTPPNSQPTRVITITKPNGGEAVVVNLSHDGKVKLDLSAIANEKITIVKVPTGEPGGAEKAIILFDNQSTITIDPFFFSGQFPLNLTVELNAQQQDLTPTDFASIFPVTDDQSILPAGGNSGPAAGADFSNPSVDPLAPSIPLPLLGPEELPNWTRTPELANLVVDDTPTFDAGQSFQLDEDALTKPPAARAGNNDNALGDDPGGQSLSGTLHYDFKHDGPAGTDPIMVDVASLNALNLTSGNQPITFVWDPSTFTLTGVINQGQPGEATIIKLQIDPATATAAGNDHPFTLEITGPLDHPGHDDPSTPGVETSFEDNLVLHLNFTLTDSNGTATPGVVDIDIDDDSPVLTQQPAEKLTVDEDDIATPWSLGTSPDTNPEGPGDQSVTQGGGGFVHPAVVTGSVAGLVAFGADGEKNFGFSADAISYFQSLNLFSKQTASPENGISLDYSITQDAVNHTITLHGYEPDTVTPGVTGNPVFDFVLNTETGDFQFKLYDELIHTPGNGENTDLRSGGPGYYDAGNDGFAESFLDAANAPAAGSIPYLDFGHIITATDGDGDTITLDGQVQISVKDDVPETHISVNPLGVVQHDETAGVQGPTFSDPADSDTSSSAVRNLFSSLETNHAGELGNDTDVAHTPSGGPAIGYAHSVLPVVVNSTVNYGADFPPESAVFSLQVTDGSYSGVKTTDGHNVYLYEVDGYIVGRVGGDGVPGSQGDANAQGTIAFAITIEQGGNIDVAQYLSLQHPNTASNDETISLLDGAIQAQLVVTDSDGDAVAATADIGSHIRFDDDGPKLIGRGESYTADEDDILDLQSVGSHPNDGNSDGSFTGAPIDNIAGPAYLSGSLAGQVNFGADGPAAGGGFNFKAETITTLEGYGLTSKGGDLSYTMVGDTLVAYVERVGANNYNPVLDRTVFTLELDSNGQFEFKLYDQLDHVYGNNGENTQLAGSNGPINNLNFGSLIIATDGDGDSVAFNGRLTITITDDVPHIVSFNETGAGVTIDESGGNNNNNVTGFGLLLVAPQFSGVENVGHDSDMNGGNPVYAANVAGVVTGAALSGADDSLTSLLTLQLNGPVAANGGVDSHLQTTDGKEIYLFVENGLIVGRIDGDNNGTIDGAAQNSPDVAAFAINISQLGQLSIAQYLSLHHEDPNNPDDRQTLIDSLIQVKLTVTDFDGDQDSRTLNIGDTIHFDDDGPKVINRATLSAEADEDGLNNVQSIGNADTGQFGETGPTPALAVVNGVAGALNVLVNFGADGPGTPAFVVKDAAPTDSGLLSQGGHVMIASDGGVVRGYVDAGANDGYQAGDRLVFTLTVGGDGSYIFTLVDQIDHPTRDGLSGDDTENLLASSIDLSSYIRAQDGDNDPVDVAAGSFKIQIRDDIPVVEARDATETTVTVTDTVDYTLHAGNVDVRGIGQGGHDLLLTGVDINEGDNTVNTNNGSIGIGDGQRIDGYEVHGPNKSGPEILTMEFVKNLDLNTDTFTGHDSFPAVKFSVDVAEAGPGDNPAVVFISATNHDDGANTDSFVGLTFKVNDVAVSATQVFDNGVLVGYVLDGVPDNATIEAIGASNFNILKVGNYDHFAFDTTAAGNPTTLTDGNPFKVYGIETEVTTTTVVTETFNISEDESAGLNNAADPNAADDVNAPANGTDAYNVLFAANAIGYAKSGESVLVTDNDFTALFTGTVGADEKPGGGGTWSFAITNASGNAFNGTDSGLTTLDGTHILLTTDATTGALIGKAGNAEVFKVYVDSDGYVWISQYQPIHNTLAGSTDAALDDIATVTVDGGLHIKATLTDYDHDSTSTVSDVALQVRFQDDGPLAVDDTDAVVGMTATGNVISGANEVVPGVDHVGTDGASVTGVTSNNEPGHNTTVNAGVLTIVGQFGTLELHPNGDYTYTRSDGAPLSANDVFTYTLTDGDGDTSTAELTITIDDSGPTPTTAMVGGNVDEDALSNHDVDGVPLRPGEVDGAALGWSAVSTGSLAPLFDPGANTPLQFSMLNSNAAIDTLINQNLKSDGVALSYSVSGDTLTGYLEAGGGSGYQSGQDTPVFTLQIATDGTYTFTLLNEIDHPKLDGQGNGNNENTITVNFGGLVHVVDNDGDPADASGPAAFQITVLDDMPSIALAGGNLIVDGDFAGGPGDFPLHVNEWQPGSGADTDGIPGWTVTASPVHPAGFVELERVGDGYLGMHTSTHGTMIDMAASPGNIAIAQTVTGAAGQTYAIQFEAGAPFPTTAQLQVYWGGQLIGTINPTGPMTSYNYVVTANGGPQTLEFREVGDVTSPTPGAADGGYHGTYLANVAMIPASIVDEDGIANGNHDQPAPSIGDAQVPNTDGDNNEATTTGSLNITWGVDDTNGGVDGTAADSGFVQDGAGGAALTGRSVYFTDASVGVSGGIPLTSHGDAVTFVLSQNNTVLTGMAGGREIFSVSLSDDGSGAYRFVLKGQLDHAPNGDENDITLTFNFSAKDFDGDAVDGHFAVGIDDDVPYVAGGDRDWTLDEDMLTNGNDGLDNPSDPNDYTSISGKDLGVHWGADGPGKLVFVASDAQHPTFTITDQNGVPLGPLTSNGIPVTYNVVTNGDGGQTLTASAGGNTIFTLTLDPDAGSNGTFGFQLLGHLDHPAGDGQNRLDLKFGFTATDGDQDPVSSDITIRITDDVPYIVGGDRDWTLDEDVLANGNDQYDVLPDTNDYTHIDNKALGVQWGADGPGKLTFAASDAQHPTFTITDQNGNPLGPLTSGGVPLTYNIVTNADGGQTLTASAGSDTIFTVTLDPDAAATGAFSFNLLGHLDHPAGGGENRLDLKFGFTATDGDQDPVSSDITIRITDDVPELTVGAGDHPQTVALALDETVEQNYTNNPGYDRYNGAETESAPGASNGGADDVTAGAGPVYNHTPVISLNPAESQAIGSLTTAAGVIGSQFGVHVSFGADGPAAGGGLSEHLGFALSSTSVATNLIATNTGAPELAGFVSDASRAISLVQVSDSVIEGRIVGDPNNANDDYIAFRLTLNNASDPANASITVDQFMAIQQDDHTKFDENTILKLAQGSLDLKLDVVATDGDQDSTPVKSFTVNLANSDGSIVSFDDDGPVVKGVVQNNVGAELIQNGSFELGHGDIGSSDWSIYSVLLPGWSAGPDNIPFEVQTGGVGGMPAQDGNSLIELDGDTQGNPAHLPPQGTPNPTHTDATIQQTVTTEAGETYQLSFWYAPRGGDGVNSSGLKVFFGGNEVYNIDPAPNPPAVWQLITIQVTATSASSVLAFQGTGGENEFGAFLDNVSLKQIIPLDDEQTNALGIAGGPGDDGNGVVATGKIDFDAGTDGLKSIELHGPASLKAIYVDANGIGHSEDVSFQWTANGAGGTLLGTMNTPDGVKNVLTVTVDGSGNYTLTLLAPLDHPGHNDPSTPATEISFEDNIDLGIGFTVTDGDGDQAAGTLHFNVDDDSPNAFAGSVNAGEVYEDGLKTPGDLSNGNAEPPALQPVSVVVTAAALANFVAAGADGLKGFGLNAGATGTVHTSTGADVKSDGVVVTYAVDNGTGDVLGMAGNREVFRLHDNGDGTFTFTLNDQIDHIPNVPADNDSQTLDINIVSAFTATDGDGDSVPLNLGSLNITVEDDIPFFAGEPYTLAVTHTDTVYSGSVDFHVGADEPGQFSITPPAINGVTTQTSTDAQTGIVTVTGTFTSSGDPYYVFTFNPATGGYTFDLENLPTTVTPLANVSTKGAFAPVQQKDFGDFTFIADAGHTVNGSAQGTGVGDDNLENGEHLTIAFDTPRTVADLGLNFVGSGTLTIAWKAIDTATGNYETGTASITADGTLSIDVLNHVQPADADPLSNDITHFDKLELTATGPNSAKAKIITVGGSEVTEDHNPGPFVFNVTGSDFDGDKDSTTITVNANIAPAIPDPLGGDGNTNILYEQIMIPLAALLGHDGITPDTGITVTNVVGATVSGDFVVLPAAGPGSDTTFSYAFTDGTTTTDSASMTIHRVDQFLNGTSGKDFFIARDWGETVNAGADNDLIIKAGATLNGGDGNDYLFGTGGNNVVSGNGGDDYIVGYGGSNTLSGGDGNDFLAGHGGTNILTGGAGNDVLYAQSTGSHNSSLDGGADNDTLYAGHYNGTTTMKGGTGNDTFEFLDYTIAPNPTAGAASTITDYTFGQDKVDLTGLLESIYGQGNAAVGDVRLAADPNNSSNAVVQIDVNTGAGQTWQSVVSLTGYNHAGNQVDVVLDHMTNQQHTYTV